ncbi:hypothetical protein AAJP47_08395 [Psychrobacter sp. B38]|uniref:hypothetical protein n=1 Tax=Psychrobacter sp. B38 TaxID=3143538 RepID=UPI00320D2B18
MNHIYRTNLTMAGLLTVMLSTSLLVTGCSTTNKASKQNTSRQAMAKQLSEPSFAYMSSAGQAKQRNVGDWMAIAKKDYEAKRYARALRAANEALSMDKQNIEARQIAMLSVVKVMESNIEAYHDNSLMNAGDKETFKDTLTNITTLINTSN